MLLNVIQVLRLRLLKTTASLKLPKSVDIGCAIAEVPTWWILAEQQAFYERLRAPSPV